ncbi:unnamed protein product [Calicophoron daubneyi]|uniref:Protein kinase domain-containing protein n=1 Tax=Calicophoron daubneyi TaxID=300641 RepID=A0AAV2T9X5_CALDB
MADCCRGLTYLEERGIIHRDIAARNILLSGDSPRMVAKVADFGMARDVHNTNPLIVQSPQPTSAPPSYPGRTSPLNTRLNPPPPFTSDHSSHPSPSPSSDPDAPCTFEPLVLHDSAAIPVKWTAPEAVRKRVFSNKSDVWSFGILLWEIYSYGRIPYPRMMANQALRQIAAGYRMKAPEGCPPEIYDLMRRTWQLNPEDRPTFATILRELVHRLDDEHRIPDHAGPDKRCSPLSHLLMRTKDGGDPWLPKQSDCGLISDNPLESTSDCYDLIDDVPAHSTSDSRQRLASSSRPDHFLMSRSFTSATGGCTGVGKCGGQSISSKLMSPGDGKSNTFCLPKFERFKL